MISMSYPHLVGIASRACGKTFPRNDLSVELVDLIMQDIRRQGIERVLIDAPSAYGVKFEAMLGFMRRNVTREWSESHWSKLIGLTAADIGRLKVQSVKADRDGAW